MSRVLCAGLPAELWDSHDDGARLALAICRRCPVQPTCLAGDPHPVGVVRAGVAFSNTGRPLSVCPTCGYPQPGDALGGGDRCPRCDVPTLSKFQPDLFRWHAAGLSDAEAGRRVGASARQVRDARRRYRPTVAPEEVAA